MSKSLRCFSASVTCEELAPAGPLSSAILARSAAVASLGPDGDQPKAAWLVPLILPIEVAPLCDDNAKALLMQAAATSKLPTGTPFRLGSRRPGNLGFSRHSVMRN